MKTLKTIIKYITKSTPAIIASIVVVVGVTYAAGSLTAPSGTPSATSYTLGDIYNKLTTGASAGSHDIYSLTTPSATFNSLSEIYNAIPTLLSLSATTTTVPVGINISTTTLDTIDTDLVASNIASSTNIFGVIGTLYGDTNPSKVLSSATYPGNIADRGSFNLTASSSDQSVTSGYYSGGTLLGDSDLVASNIKNGVNIFGVTGSLNLGVIYATNWSSDNPSGVSNYAAAIAYCSSSVEGGVSSGTWRLPTYAELANAYLTSNPGNNLNFSSTTSSVYWSSTQKPSDSTHRYGVDIVSGGAIDSKDNSNYHSRCVR